MTTRYILLVVICLLQVTTKAQINLINNPSFEMYSICPSSSFVPNPINWYAAGKFGSSYWNNCSIDVCFRIPNICCSGGYNFQYAKTGNGFIGNLFHNGGIGGNKRNYMQTKLNDSLRKGIKYEVTFYVNNCSFSDYAVNNISALLTNIAVYVDTLATPFGVLSGNAQIYNYGNPIIFDTLNWVKVSSIYKAQGGEQYLTLGNFKYDNQTKFKTVNSGGTLSAGYLIDDVSVYELDNSYCINADAGRDTTIKPNDSVFIGSYTNGIDTIKWYNSNGQVIDSVQPGFWVKPNATGNYRYIVEQTVNGCYSKDSVFVNVILPLRMLSLTLNPSPTERDFIVANWTTANEVNVSHHNILRSTNAKDFEKVGTVKANNNSYNEYSYTDELKPSTQYPTALYYKIESVDKDGRKQYSAIKSLTINPSSLNVTIYPNPTKDVVNIYSKEGIKEVRLFNVMGQQIATETNLGNDDNMQHLPFNIQHYVKGIYFLKVKTKSGMVINEKLVIQ